MRKDIFGKVEVRARGSQRQCNIGASTNSLNVSVEGVDPLILLEIGDILDHVLEGCVVHKDIHSSHLLDGSVNDFLAVLTARKVGCHQVALAPVFLDTFLRVLRVTFLLR